MSVEGTTKVLTALTQRSSSKLIEVNGIDFITFEGVAYSCKLEVCNFISFWKLLGIL